MGGRGISYKSLGGFRFLESISPKLRGFYLLLKEKPFKQKSPRSNQIILLLDLPLPDPADPVQWLFAFIGVMVCGAMADYDWDLQQSVWFGKLDGFDQAFWKFLFDLGHRWWVGALLFYYPLVTWTFPIMNIGVYTIGGWTFTTIKYALFLQWFGWGMFIGDIKDLQNMLRRYPALIPILERVFPEWEYVPEEWDIPDSEPVVETPIEIVEIDPDTGHPIVIDED